jgi:hypothetical protein
VTRPQGWRRPPARGRQPSAPDGYRSWAEQAAAATSWAEWFAAERLGNPHGTPVHPVPWALDWQRNPAAPLPPGYVLARCLCLVTVARRPDWHGQVRDSHGRLRFPVGPAVAVGDLCERTLGPDGAWHGCGAPLRQIAHRGAPYVFDFLLRDPDPHRCGRCPWCLHHPAPARRLAAVPAPASAPPQAPGGEPGPGRFGSMAAERAWVAAQRRLGKVG